MAWISFKGENKQYPPEGIDVVIGDDLGNEDIAYFIMSGEYVWVTFDYEADETKIFTRFTPTKWTHIRK